MAISMVSRGARQPGVEARAGWRSLMNSLVVLSSLSHLSVLGLDLEDVVVPVETNTTAVETVLIPTTGSSSGSTEAHDGSEDFPEIDSIHDEDEADFYDDDLVLSPSL